MRYSFVMDVRNNNKLLFFSFLLVIFILCLVSINSPSLSKLQKTVSKSSSSPISHVPPLSKIRLLFVGDIMLSRGVADQINRNQDYIYPFQDVKDFLKSADVTFGNLEGPISDRGTELGHLYSFRALPKSIDGLTAAGFDILSLANNHAFDWGIEALTDTTHRLRTQKINVVGAGQNFQEAYQPTILNIKGQKIAFLAATDIPPENAEATLTKAGIAWMKPEIISQEIQKLKSKVDLIIVSMHSGKEYQNRSNTSQQKFARLMIDAGANLVIGHHPHVIQEYEKYKNGHVFYSLGNFVFDQNWSDQTSIGQVVEISIKQRILSINTYQAQISKSTFQPQISQNSKKQIFVDR
ncbi:MAG: Capsule biosynthesis protein CapA [Berkelbacteria bacterium GW2011_GWA2_38_9]|uniref:Capsule biosynthesis protein CapA n=1 Tax=Berkelbacteria bacterium GW2011_GWA2_38_9 TaxID=1618334 RepID=A0A0G0PB60_9BACT|nr:MAG: Capsule biosynthesis protein CapA [Berkelbacteria bacterium GW2011_GWA2_38_9]